MHDGSDASEDEATVLGAMSKLVFDLLMVHPLANGNVRLAQMALYVESARLGEALAPIHDPSKVESISAGAGMLRRGQAAVRSWGA
jgi:hypothetical protein